MEKKKSHLWLRTCFFSFLLIISIISFLRVPYFGVFIDSIILDFIFGSAKLIIYCLCVTIAITSFIRNQKIFKILTARKTWIIYFVFINIYLMIISLIYFYQVIQVNPTTYSNAQDCFTAYFGENWRAVSNSEYLWSANHINQLLHPGIIWLIILMIVKFAPIAFIFITLILWTSISIMFILYKFNVPFVIWVVKFLRKIKAYFSNPMTLVENNDDSKEQHYKKNGTGEIIKNISKTEMIPFSLNSEFNEKYQNFAITDFDDIEDNNTVLNDEYAKNVINNIGEVFEKNQVNCAFLEYQLGPSSLKILFSFPDEKETKMVTSENIHKKLIEVLQIKNFTFFIKNERLIIDLPLIERNKISFKKTMDKLTISKTDNEFSGLIGVDGNFDPIELNFNETPITLVHGHSNSGKQTLLMQLVLSLLIRYSPNEFMMAVIDNKNTLLCELDRVRNMADNIAINIESGIEMMEKILFEMKYRVKLLKDLKYETIDEFNENQAKMVPSLLVIINDISDFMNYDIQYVLRFLKLINRYSKQLKVYCVISTNTITPVLASQEMKKIYKNVISLQTRTSQESELLINKTILHKLFGEGDFYYIKNAENPKIQRGQSTFINNDLINQIIRKVNNY